MLKIASHAIPCTARHVNPARLQVVVRKVALRFFALEVAYGLARSRVGSLTFTGGDDLTSGTGTIAVVHGHFGDAQRF